MNIFIKMRHLWSTDVSLIRLGEDGDEHCEGSVVVKDSQNQPDPESWWWKPRQMSSVKCREFIFKIILQSSYHGDLLRMTSLCEWENTTTAPRREETTSRISDRSRPHLNTIFRKSKINVCLKPGYWKRALFTSDTGCKYSKTHEKLKHHLCVLEKNCVKIFTSGNNKL